MKVKIGELAGQIYSVLSEQKELSLSKLAKSITGTQTEIYQAIGWLAREDKILYRTVKNRTFISLVQ